MKKGRMTTALKVWLNPGLVDVKRMAAGQAPGYISFYDRKMAHFKARDKRVALIMKQRQGFPTDLLLRQRRLRPIPPKIKETTAADLRTEAEMQEARRVRDVRVAYLLYLRGVRIQGIIDGSTMHLSSPPHFMAPGGSNPKNNREKGSLAMTRIRRRKHHAAEPPALLKFDRASTLPKSSLSKMVNPLPVIRQHLPAAPAQPLGDRVYEHKLTEEMEAALCSMGNESFFKTEQGPEPAPSSAPDEIEKDEACVTIMRMCVAAMHPLELSYWRDQEYREARLEWQRKIWQEEEDRARGQGLEDEERSGYLDVTGKRRHDCIHCQGVDEEGAGQWVAFDDFIDTLDFLGASLEIKAEAERGISRGNDKLSLGTYAVRRACSGGMDSSGLRKITQRFGLGTDDALQPPRPWDGGTCAGRVCWEGDSISSASASRHQNEMEEVEKERLTDLTFGWQAGAALE
ncbi:hypothetical protein DFH09DRAFT_1404040 [Mycena vulgaris]|nr:hypothetical protein DFH09DRAFT_1404040 [Mycena vulgaris]